MGEREGIGTGVEAGVRVGVGVGEAAICTGMGLLSDPRGRSERAGIDDTAGLPVTGIILVLRDGTLSALLLV